MRIARKFQLLKVMKNISKNDAIRFLNLFSPSLNDCHSYLINKVIFVYASSIYDK